MNISKRIQDENMSELRKNANLSALTRYIKLDLSLNDTNKALRELICLAKGMLPAPE